MLSDVGEESFKALAVTEPVVVVGKVQLEEGPTEILDGDTHSKGVGPTIVPVFLFKGLEGLHPRRHGDALV